MYSINNNNDSRGSSSRRSCRKYVVDVFIRKRIYLRGGSGGPKFELFYLFKEGFYINTQ